MSSPTTRMLQAIGEVAGNHLLQDLIIYRESSVRLLLAELVFSGCHMQHMVCSNGRGLHVFNYFRTRADPVTGQPCDGRLPSSSMGASSAERFKSFGSNLLSVGRCSILLVK